MSSRNNVYDLSQFSEKLQSFFNQWVFRMDGNCNSSTEEVVETKRVTYFEILNSLISNTSYSVDFSQNIASGEIIGVAKVGPYYLQTWMDDLDVQRMIVCHAEDHSMIIIEASEDFSIRELDLPEGSAFSGYGTDRDYKNNRLFEGFLYKGIYVCHGTLFNPQTNTAVYNGCLVNGVRYGKGVEYNRRGSISQDCYWFDNKQISKRDAIPLPWMYWTEDNIAFEPTFGNHKEIYSLYLTPLMINLKVIIISSESFNFIQEFSIDGLPELLAIRIGERSFGAPGGKLSIMNCPKFKGIIMKEGAFIKFTQLELVNLPSMEDVSMQLANFIDIKEFHLHGM